MIKKKNSFYFFVLTRVRVLWSFKIITFLDWNSANMLLSIFCNITPSNVASHSRELETELKNSKEFDASSFTRVIMKTINLSIYEYFYALGARRWFVFRNWLWHLGTFFFFYFKAFNYAGIWISFIVWDFLLFLINFFCIACLVFCAANGKKVWFLSFFFRALKWIHVNFDLVFLWF